MQKYLVLTIGFKQPSPEMMEEWNKWFDSYKDSIVEQVGLMNGREIIEDNVTDLEMDEGALTGYLVVEMENMDAAIQLAKQCPAVTSTRVYELR